MHIMQLENKMASFISERFRIQLRFLLLRNVYGSCSCIASVIQVQSNCIIVLFVCIQLQSLVQLFQCSAWPVGHKQHYSQTYNYTLIEHTQKQNFKTHFNQPFTIAQTRCVLIYTYCNIHKLPSILNIQAGALTTICITSSPYTRPI